MLARPRYTLRVALERATTMPRSTYPKPYQYGWYVAPIWISHPGVIVVATTYILLLLRLPRTFFL